MEQATMEKAQRCEIPQPYDEEKDPDKFWKRDPFDSVLPKQKGFISDVVYYMRGMEVSTLYTIWSALWLLSTVIKRDAWLNWYPDKMYGNLYVVLAGPAGCKKSTMVDAVGVPIVEAMQQHIKDHNVKLMKNVNIAKDKMTPEALLEAMLPGSRPKSSFYFTDDQGNKIHGSDGQPVRYKATSEIGIVLSEMSSSIGKKSYTEGFVEILLDLYNPKGEWQWRTKSQGIKYLRRTYISMLAATTPAAFKESVPKVAAGDGFLSRCVIAYHTTSNRRFPVPRPVPNGPSLDELSKRLAWIAENALEEFHLSNEAYELYAAWYYSYKDYLEANVMEQGVKGRMDINLLKVSLLLRCQRYTNEPGRIISKGDMEDAMNIIQATYATSQELLSDMDDGIVNLSGKVLKVLVRHKKVKRTDLLRKTHMPAADINAVLDYLTQAGEIDIVLNGKKKLYPSRDGDELYIYKNNEEGTLDGQDGQDGQESTDSEPAAEPRKKGKPGRKPGRKPKKEGTKVSAGTDTDREDDKSV